MTVILFLFTLQYGSASSPVQDFDLTYIELPKPAFLEGPYTSHVRVYIRNLQQSRLWYLKVRPG